MSDHGGPKMISYRWWSELTDGLRRNAHWLTRIGYYHAVISLIESGATGIAWTDVVGRVRPHGCRSAFYDVAGRNARHSLHRAFAASDDPDLMQLALRYQRTDSVARLVDEAKVWSFWSAYGPRPGPSAGRAHARPGAPDPAERVLAEFDAWVRANPALAASAAWAPPMCVAEELVCSRTPAIAGVRAFSLLADRARALGTEPCMRRPRSARFA